MAGKNDIVLPTLYLVCDLEHEFYDFPYSGNVIIPTDELYHFSEGLVQPPTRPIIIWLIIDCPGFTIDLP